MCSPVWETDIDRNWYNTGWRDKSWEVLLKLYILGKQEIDESTCRPRSPETSQSLFLCCGGHRQVRLCTFLTDGSPLSWPSVLLSTHFPCCLPVCPRLLRPPVPQPDGVFKWPSPCRHVSGGKSCSAPQLNSWRTCWPCSWVSRATGESQRVCGVGRILELGLVWVGRKKNSGNQVLAHVVCGMPLTDLPICSSLVIWCEHCNYSLCHIPLAEKWEGKIDVPGPSAMVKLSSIWCCRSAGHLHLRGVQSQPHSDRTSFLHPDKLTLLETEIPHEEPSWLPHGVMFCWVKP